MLDIKLAPRRNEYSKSWEYDVLEDVAYDFQGTTIVVPQFFSYDGASIPSLAWQTIYTPFDPIVMAPALVHDWLYSNQQVDRDDADKVLRKLLKDNGVPSIKVDLIYRAVQFFGGAAWENTSEDLKYLRWLRQKLLNAGVNVDKYHFPSEVLK